MKEKNLEVTVLLDFYGDILTEKQREVLKLYYDEDLSLAEIAEHAQITRQGVRDCIKRGEAVLFEMEEKLGLMKRFRKVKKSLETAVAAAEEIEAYNARFYSSRKISENTAKIISTVKKLFEE